MPTLFDQRRRASRRLFALLVVLLLSLTATIPPAQAAASAALVVDSDPTVDPAPGSTPRGFTTIGDRTYFVATDQSNGRELWVTDGSPSGTHLLADLVGGPVSAFADDPNESFWLTDVDGSLFFPVRGALWRSDGTPLGTRLVAQVAPPTSTTTIDSLTAVGNRLFFVTRQNSDATALWTSDGTAAGTVQLMAPINAGWPARLVAYAGTLRFFHGGQLWSSDGTPQGTIATLDASGAGLQQLAGWLFFRAPAPGGTALWRSDGTPGGTQLIKSFFSLQFALAAVGDTIFFEADNHLWKSDGTAAGTAIVEGAPRLPSGLVAAGDRLFFVASNGGYELWTSDGTAAGTYRVPNLRPEWDGSYISALTSVGGRIFFTADNAEPNNTWSFDLWTSDGTAEGTRRLWNGAGLSPRYLAASPTGLLFAAPTPAQGMELWHSDGTVAGTTLLRDIHVVRAGIRVREGLASGATLFYLTSDYMTSALWISDGTPGGTRKLKVFSHWANHAPNLGVVVGGVLYFSAADSGEDTELWASDGTPGGTRRVRDIRPGIFGSAPEQITAWNGKLYFHADDGSHGRELWVSDGSPGGTQMLKDMRPGPDSSLPDDFTPFGEALFFGALTTNGTSALWRTDGTAAGTQPTADFASGTATAKPSILGALNGKLFVSARNGAGDRQLWASDGTTGGSVALADLAPDTAEASVVSASFTAEKAFFLVYPHAGAVEQSLWVSDGTASGTRRLTTVSRDTRVVTCVGDLAFFMNATPGSGRELWRSDGTASGTFEVADIRPGPTTSQPAAPQPLTSQIFLPLEERGRVLFAADDGVHGAELWQSDGTQAGTGLVQEIVPGQRGALPLNLLRAGATIFFEADDQQHGAELWALPLAGIPEQIASVRGPRMLAPNVDTPFALTLHPAPTATTLEYTWEATDLPPLVRVGGLSDSVMLRWASPGAKLITVTARSGVTVLAVGSFVAFVEQAAGPTVQFAAPHGAVSERDGTAAITVTLTSSAPVPIRVGYASSNGTATGGQDYGAVSGTLTFAPGERQQEIIVPILDDTLVETTETLLVTLSTPEGATLSTPSGVTIAIRDDDVVVQPGTSYRVYLPLVRLGAGEVMRH